MSLALYRRYRPETFGDVVGQEHVTEPLSQALRTERVNHAYLFSGPRGCGKTTSARILARCLNCEQGPTPTPCGTCPSCLDLARGGPGSLDVVEIDAASHGGVDDARDLRERAAMAPVRYRYKVYIIDEAHMVSTQGFNALLKLVEEPPGHVKFVFATTEPDKVLQTIRSRTHHYAFRLVPPDVLIEYLSTLCDSESVPVGPGVLPLVVRAGQGSVRDSLSVLDQLIAGADEQGLQYAGAVALLGYTDNALLDDVVDALAALDGAALFSVVNRVVESGHDPRRFVEDLLERLRDLILLQAMGPAADGVLRAVPPDQLQRMRSQSAALGAAELSRAADTTNAALAEMVGASSPRMHLELLCARLLLPAADDTTTGLAPRVERLERRLGQGGSAPVAPATAAESARPAPPPAPSAHRDPPMAVPTDQGREPPADQVPPGVEVAPSVPPPGVGAPPAADLAQRQAPPAHPGGRPATSPAERSPAARQAPPRVPVTAEPPPTASPAGQTPTPAGGFDTERMRRSWPEVQARVKPRRATWMLLTDGSHVHELAAGVLRLSFTKEGNARGFFAGRHPQVVAEAIKDLFDLDVRVEPARGPLPSPQPRRQPSVADGPAHPDQPENLGRIEHPAASSDSAPSPGGEAWPAAPPVRPESEGSRHRDQSGAAPGRRPPPATGPAAGTTQPGEDQQPTRSRPGSSASRNVSSTDAWGVPFGPEPDDDAPPEDWTPRAPGAPTPPAQHPHQGQPHQGQHPSRAPHPSATEPRLRLVPDPPAAPTRPTVAPEDDEPSDDDPTAEDSGMIGQPVVERLLGGKVIDIEERH